MAGHLTVIITEAAFTTLALRIAAASVALRVRGAGTDAEVVFTQRAVRARGL